MYCFFSEYDMFRKFSNPEKFSVLFNAALSFLMNTFLCKLAYDKDIS